ncbi:TonB-dependent receptor plug domain-containing protein [Algoriphagus sp. CAU 1675]|uniref:TonB-dependent receptor plug domain-containing protein n=1 Tax=Algoriphagus sp. CAU 1675 TaxID=3032597 RepID=UPI0023DAB3F6|nr:TonB-dependent receptor plug domain-containing protein [Algoriphagus sp. CAU 1675]MDF2158977.1 TonB-dependent receptor plug domain-containing protein [Algoriphagus sp. CAU 1675]
MKLSISKKIKYSFGVLLCVTSVFLLSFSPPTNPFERIIAAFERYISEMPQEKVYLHLDRPFYAAGETIWFKAYLTAGPYHEPSLLSRTIYVELINAEGEIIQHLKVFSPDGFASGHLDLPDSLAYGNYLLRSYTNWMRNSDEAYFFHRPLKILSNSTPVSTQFHSGELDIQFFPEGGNLVNGIMSKVAFKAVGEKGLGEVVKGKILEDGIEITEFESNQLGMGVFPLLPKKGKQYKAVIEEIDLEVLLPSPLDSGIVMAVNNSTSASDLVVKIQASENYPIQNLHLLAQTRGIVCASSQVDLSKKVLIAKIPKKEFPSGIAQITALDEKGNPLAERLVFIDHQDQLNITISTEKSVFAPRDSVRVNIEAKTKDGLPAMANLSLTVFDGGQTGINENKETIQSNLLISSELKGYIESPGYYFNPENSDREEALDFLMLTQGWRRFTIKEALGVESAKPIYRVEKGLTIRGQLTDQNKKPVEEGTVSYLSLFPLPETKTATSNSNGMFEIHDLIFFDSTKFVLQGKPNKGRSPVEVLTHSSHEAPELSYPIFSSIPEPTISEKDFLSKSVERREIDKAYNFENPEYILEGVEVKDTKIKEENTGARIYGNGTVNIQVADNPALENQQHPLNLVQGRVPGVQVWGNGENWTVLIQGVSSIHNKIEPLIMVDDLPVPLESLSNIPVYEIESYKVWKGPDTAIFGARGANGVIGFYTRRAKVGTSLPKEEVTSPSVSGYQLEKEFYSPKYSPQEPLLVKPDRRITLFWAPSIQTDSEGKASVLFYNHDVESEIHGEIEGIGIDGTPGSSRFQYRINK